MSSFGAGRLLGDFSLEITAKDAAALASAAPLLPPATAVSVTYLASETPEARVAAATAVRRLGLTPVPHISARRLKSQEALRADLDRLVCAAAVDRVFVIAGDLETVEGLYPDSLAVIRSGLLQASGVRSVGMAGHPGGHGQVPEPALWQALKDKTAALAEAGMMGEIVTQFAFDADAVLDWLARLRDEGVELPVRIGLPGPASVATLVRFASRCGVEASARVLAKYGVSMGRLIGSAGPDRLVERLHERLSPGRHGVVRTHLYPFGGVVRTAEWVRSYTGLAAA